MRLGVTVDVETWIEPFTAVDPPSVDNRSAVSAFLQFIQGAGSDLAHFEGYFSKDGLQLVVLKIKTGRPQRPAIALHHEERVGVLFFEDDAAPIVFMLRDDFPDTYHQQFVPEGWPRAICIDDRLWEEARLNWTPAELLSRILNWFQRAADGKLHDARQPLDPHFITTDCSFIVDRELLADPASDLVAIHEDSKGSTLLIERLSNDALTAQHVQPICILPYRIPPQQMKRLQYAPRNLASLAQLLNDSSVDLLEDLKQRFSEWLQMDAADADWRMQGRLALVIEMPIVAPDGSQQPGEDVRAFISMNRTGEIAEFLGVAVSDPNNAAGDGVLFRRSIPQRSIDREALVSAELAIAEVHLTLDRSLAARLSAQAAPDLRKAVLVGAGAIGSHIAEALTREGRYHWTIIDHDRILPHNLARHTALYCDVRDHKAEVVAQRLSAILSRSAGHPTAITKAIVSSTIREEPVSTVLSEADIIIDATASIAAERLISDHSSSARRFSVFLNPDGRAAIILAESSDRSLTIRDLESQYLRAICHTPALSGHLNRQGEAIAYTGACRAITNQIPESRVMMLAGILTSALGRIVSSPDPAVMVWDVDADMLEMKHYAFDLFENLSFQVDDWTITIDTSLVQSMLDQRTSSLPSETGGILLGIVDVTVQSIHILVALPPPPDSKASSSGFERGSQGVSEELARYDLESAGQIRYVGEWHSHPPRASTLPSATDLVQIDWLANLMQSDALPALMIIAGDNNLRVVLAGKEAIPTELKNSRGSPDE